MPEHGETGKAADKARRLWITLAGAGRIAPIQYPHSCDKTDATEIIAVPVLRNLFRRLMENFWQTCSAQLEQELTPQQFSAWIKPLAPLDFEDGRLRIAAPNRFKLDWVKTQFASRISTLARF